MTLVSDGHLLKAFRTMGDQEAFAELLRRHGSMVRATARSVIGHAGDMDDIAQAAFLTLARKADTLERMQSLGGWLYHVTVCLARNERQKQQRRQTREREAAKIAEPPDPPPALSEADLKILHEEIAGLADVYREPVVLHHLEGKSYEEASAALQCNPNTFGARLTRAREKLRRRLAGRGIVMGVGAIGLVLEQNVTAAPLPAAFVTATCQAATAVVTGHAAAGVAISAKVAELTDSAVKFLFWAKVKAAALVCAGAAVAGLTVATAVRYGAQAAGPAPQGEGEIVPPVEQGAATGNVPPALDGGVVQRVTPESGIQAALDQAEPGDQIVLAPGTYYESVIVRRGGLPGKPVTIRAEQPGTAILSGADPALVRQPLAFEAFGDPKDRVYRAPIARPVTWVLVDGRVQYPYSSVGALKAGVETIPYQARLCFPDVRQKPGSPDPKGNEGFAWQDGVLYVRHQPPGAPGAKNPNDCKVEILRECAVDRDFEPVPPTSTDPFKSTVLYTFGIAVRASHVTIEGLRFYMVGNVGILVDDPPVPSNADPGVLRDPAFAGKIVNGLTVRDCHFGGTRLGICAKFARMVGRDLLVEHCEFACLPTYGYDFSEFLKTSCDNAVARNNLVYSCSKGIAFLDLWPKGPSRKTACSNNAFCRVDLPYEPQSLAGPANGRAGTGKVAVRGRTLPRPGPRWADKDGTNIYPPRIRFPSDFDGAREKE